MFTYKLHITCFNFVRVDSVAAHSSHVNILPGDDDDCYLLVHQKKLAALLSPLLCPRCKHNTLDVTTADTSRRGYANKLEIVCSGCAYGHAEFTSPQLVTDDNASRQPYEINHRAVLAAREVGIGQRELVKMLAIMNVKGSLHHKTFQAINRQVLGKLIHGPASDNLQQSHSITRQLYDGLYGPCDGQRDITVSFDGTWHIKGHSSSVGACFVIDTLSGLVLDYVVLSKYCAECQLVGDKLTGEEKTLWLEAHRTDCDRNHFGSSGAMETAGAKLLWSRSVDVTSFRYTALLGDGDAAVLDCLNTTIPYPGINIQKEECINHVSKRMFKGLERVVKEVNAEVKVNRARVGGMDEATPAKKGRGKAAASNSDRATALLLTTMGGKGRMTGDRMKKWSSYYRKAIVENAPDVKAARDAVWAIFFHLVSTVDDPHHSRCSPSWCFWQQALAEGVDPEVKFAQTKHDVPLPRDVSYRLVPLFERLASEDLLSRCMRLQTSNVNECLHSLVWRRAPKAKYCGKRTIEMAVALAVLQFNKGASALADAVVSLGASPGISLTTVASTIDSERLRFAKISAKTESKTTRKRAVLEKMRKEQRMEAAEGGLYEAGGH